MLWPVVDTVLVVPVYLIRHASAGVRSVTGFDDELRPLDATGLAQAAAIAACWAEDGIDAIYTSPAVRCRQTVQPLAERFDRQVIVAPQLAIGAAPSQSIAFVRSFTGHNVALCSHGDVIPDILRALEIGGTRLEGRGCPKAGVWQLDNSTERIESGVLLPPPPVLSPPPSVGD